MGWGKASVRQYRRSTSNNGGMFSSGLTRAAGHCVSLGQDPFPMGENH